VKRENPEPSCILGVFGLSGRTSEKTLRDLYGQYGKVEQCSIVLDRESGRSRGFGFVYFDTMESAQRARDATNGMDLDGRNIRVDFSKTNRPHSPTPGRYMGRYQTSRYDRYDSRRDRRYYRDRSPHQSYHEREYNNDSRSRDHSYRRRSRSPPRHRYSRSPPRGHH
jgi:transformer-2 protein